MAPPGRPLVTDVPVVMGVSPVIAGPFNYPNGDRAYTMTIRRATTADPTPFPDPNTHIRVSVQGSLDSVNWIHLAGFTTTGGVVIGEDGQEETENLFLFSIPSNSPLTGQNNRKVRVVFETLAGPPPTLIVSVASA